MILTKDSQKTTFLELLTKEDLVTINDNTKEFIFLISSKWSLSFDKEYYIYDKRLKKPWNRYVRLKPVYFFSAQGGVKNSWYVKRGFAEDMEMYKDKGNQYKTYVVFRAVKLGRSRKTIESNSRLKGYTNVLDNRDYFADFPRLNELWHWDNYVDIYSEHRYKIEFDPNTQVNLYNDFGQKATIIDPRAIKTQFKHAEGTREISLAEANANKKYWTEGYSSKPWETYDYTGLYYKTWDNFNISMEIFKLDSPGYTKETAKGHVEL